MANKNEEGKKTKKPWIRKRVWIPIVAVLAAGSALFTPLPEPKNLFEYRRQGQYLEDFLNQRDNAFHDYMYAARISIPFSRENCEGERYNKLQKEFNALYSSEKKQEEISKEIVKYVEENKPALDIVRVGLTREKCESPEIRGPDEELPYLAQFRNLARLFILDGKIKETKGNIDGAMQDYYDALNFGNDIPRGGYLIHGLVGIAVQQMAIDAVKQNLNDLNESQLSKVIQEFDNAEKNAVQFIDVMKPEIKTIKKYTTILLRNRADVANALTDKGNVTIPGINITVPKTFAVNACWLYLNARRGMMHQTFDEFEKLSLKVAELPSNCDEEKMINEYLEEKDGPIMRNPVLRILVPALGRAKEAFSKRDAILEGVKLRAAAKIYEKRNNKQIDNLSQLVDSGIIDKIPRDPFSNKPFSYIDGKIYSYGHDLDDDKAVKNAFDRDERGKSGIRGNGDMVF